MELKFAVIFAAVDRMTDMVSHISDSVGEMGNKFQEVGEGISRFGERMALSGALIGEGAEKLAGWSEKITEPAVGMSDAIAHLSAVSGLAGDSLARVKDAAIAFSNTHAGITAEDYVGTFQQMTQVLGDTTRAIQATTVAGKLAELTHTSAAEAGNVLATTFGNLRSGATETGDAIASAMRQFKIGGEDIGRFNMMLGRMSGIAHGTNTSMAELVSVVGEVSTLRSGRGAQQVGSALEEFVTKAVGGKFAGIEVDTTHGILAALDQVASKIKGLSGSEQLAKLDVLLGGRGGGGGAELGERLMPLLNNLDRLHAKIGAVAGSSGMLDRMVGTEESGAGKHLQLLGQNLANLFDAMASPALPALTVYIGKITSAFNVLSGFFDAHPMLGESLIFPLVGLATVLGVAAGALQVGGASIAIFGQGIKALGLLVGGLKYVFMQAIPAIWSFTTALLANPLVWIPAAVIAVGALAFAIYEYWGPITAFVSKVWTSVKAVFSGAWDWMKTAGINLIKALAEGILSGVKWVTDAASTVAESVMKFFRGHSPPVFGPLHDIGNLKIVEAIAETFDPRPVYNASRKVALAGMLPLLLFSMGSIPPMLSGNHNAPAFAGPHAGESHRLALAGNPKAASKNELHFHITVEVKGGSGSGADIANQIADALPGAVSKQVDKIDQILRRHAVRQGRRDY